MKFPNIASFLKSATTNINIASATAPSNGQVLTATSSTTATWQTPSTGRRLLFVVAGSIATTGTNMANTYVLDKTYTISQCNMWLGTAGNGTLTVDINLNGTTIFNTTKPSITTTNQSSINTGTITTTSGASGNVLTLDIDAVQTTTKGIDLYVELILT